MTEPSGRWVRIEPVVDDTPHICPQPDADLESIGNGSLWQCATCNRSYRFNRRGAEVSWTNA